MKKSFFYISVIYLLIACKHPAQQQKEILDNFDSLSRQLDEVNRQFPTSSAAIYDSLAKYGRTPELTELEHKMEKFKLWLTYLKQEFKLARTNNNSEDLSVSNDFFFGDGPGKEFFSQLSTVQQLLIKNAKTAELKQEIAKMTEVPENKRKDGFMKSYFYFVPPVAASTILSKFENDIARFEQQVLLEHLNQ